MLDIYNAFIKYTTTGAIPYRQGGFVIRVNNCNGFKAVNTGDDPVTINDQILYPGTPGTIIGDSMTVGGNLGEIFVGTIKIAFAGIGVAPEVTIDQKQYVLPDNEQLV